MAYSSITKPGDHFNTVLYTGNGSTQSVTGVGFQPDWVWGKNRSSVTHHALQDAVRGNTKVVKSSSTNAESTVTNMVTSFDSDGFSLGSDSDMNGSSANQVAWNWLAGSTAPAITYVVKVVSDSGNKYRFDDYGTSAVTLDLQEGGTYTFDQSDSSNSGHPLRFYTASDKTGGEYTTGVTTTGTPGSSGAQTVITVAASAPTLYYQCSNHAGMGGQANTNSTFGSSNFGGSIQSTVSANTTAGFSIIKYTGTGSAGTIGHGLGSAPLIIIFKKRSATSNWYFYTYQIDGSCDELSFSYTEGKTDRSLTSPTSSLFYVDNQSERNGSSADQLAYVFAEKKGFSKFGIYTGLSDSGTDGSIDDIFVYTGFKPAFLLLKKYNSSGTGWFIFDNTRDVDNPISKFVMPQASNDEDSSLSRSFDLLSNGFKSRGSSDDTSGAGSSYLYMAFAENPFVGNDSGTAVPATAR